MTIPLVVGKGNDVIYSLGEGIVDYSSDIDGISANVGASSSSLYVTDGWGDVDTLSGISRIIGSSYDDHFSINFDSSESFLRNLVTIDGGTGTDSVFVTAGFYNENTGLWGTMEDPTRPQLILQSIENVSFDQVSGQWYMPIYTENKTFSDLGNFIMDYRGSLSAINANLSSNWVSYSGGLISVGSSLHTYNSDSGFKELYGSDHGDNINIAASMLGTPSPVIFHAGIGDDTIAVSSGSGITVKYYGGDDVIEYARYSNIVVWEGIAQEDVSSVTFQNISYGSNGEAYYDCVVTITDRGSITIRGLALADSSTNDLLSFDAGGKIQITNPGVGGLSYSFTGVTDIGDELFGTNGSDTIVDTGATSVDIYGYDGNDNILVSSYNQYASYHDNVKAGNGDDVVTISGGQAGIALGGGDDTFYGDGGVSYVSGGSGNDSFYIGDGIHSLYGGEGDDAYYIDSDAIFDVYDTSGLNTLHFDSDYDLEDYNIFKTVLNYSDSSSDLYYFELKSDATYNFDVVGIVDIYFNDVLIDFSAGFTFHVTYVHYDNNGYMAAYGTDGNDTIYGTVNNSNSGNLRSPYQSSHYFGGLGSDIIYGSDSAEYLYGEEGNDGIISGSGEDYLDGGSGNDHLSGGDDNDVYVFSEGHDVIDENSASGPWNDQILLREGIGFSDLTFKRVGDDLVISEGENSLTVLGQYLSDSDSVAHYNSIERIYAHGGGYMDLSGVALLVEGDGVRFALYGGVSDDIINGTSSDEVLIGGAGNDILNGGGGNDQFNGEYGDDIYIFDSSFSSSAYVSVYDSGGNDQIRLMDGITASDVISWVDSQGYWIQIAGSSGNKILMPGYYSYTEGGVPSIESIIFSDDSVWDLTEGVVINNGSSGDVIFSSIASDIIYGNGGDDIIYGLDGDDTIIGGDGADSLVGGNGNDLYIFADDFSASSTSEVEGVLEFLNYGNDTLWFTGGLTKEDFYIWTSYETSWQLHIQLKSDAVNNYVVIGGGTDWNTTVDIGDYIETILFDDESQIDLTQGLWLNDRSGSNWLDGSMQADTIYANDGDDTVFSYDGDDIIYGGDGDDSLNAGDGDNEVYGEGGNDSIFSGSGNDYISGGGGDDYISGGAGNDFISGGEGNNILVGGAGNDWISSGTGDDLYYYYRGSETDIITDMDGDDELRIFGYTPSEMAFSQDGSNLVITLSQAGDIIVINNYFNLDVSSGIETISYLESIQQPGIPQLVEFHVNPIARDDIFSVNEDTVLANNLLFNNGNGFDSDGDGDTLSVVSGTYSTAQGGVVVVSSNGEFVYTPASNFNGEDSFEYTLSDSGGGSDIGLVTITVNPVNDSPVITSHPDDFIVNVSVVEGVKDVTVVTAEDVDGTVGLTYSISGGADSDKFSINSLTGALSFINAPDFENPQDVNEQNIYVVQVSASDGSLTDARTFFVEVLDAVEASIEAKDDDFSVNYGEYVLGNIFADNGNGADLGGIPPMVVETEVTSAAGVLVQISSNGNFIYKANEDFIGSDNFTYTLTDGVGGTDTATVTIVTAAPAGALVGSEIGDFVEGTASDDIIIGLASSDTLYGHDGADVIYGGSDGDWIFGGNGDDILGSDDEDGMDYIYGDGGADIINGGLGMDFLFGGEGDDHIIGGSDYSSDYLYGDDGDDYLDGGLGMDFLYGGAGNDVLIGGVEEYSDNGLYAGDGDDALYGSLGNDMLEGGAGYDELYGGMGNDYYYFSDSSDVDVISDDGGASDSIVISGQAMIEDFLFSVVNTNDLRITHASNSGNYITIVNHLNASTSNQVEILQLSDGVTLDLTTYGSWFFGDATSQVINGGIGSDVIFGRNGADTISGGAGNDQLFGDAGDDILYGDDGDDLLSGGSGDDTLSGGSGHDLFFDGSGNDVFSGGLGNDRVIGSVGNDVVIGGDGYDGIIYNAFSSEVIIYRDHADYITIQSTDLPTMFGPSNMLGIDKIYNDVEYIQFADRIFDLTTMAFDLGGDGWGYMAISGTAESDVLNGTVSSDGVSAGDGNDVIYGNRGDDFLYGEGGNDLLYGESGNDWLYGGDGLDTLSGGSGADRFVFEAWSMFNNVDVISDFSLTDNDVIDISYVLQGFDPLSSAITDFIQITDNGTDSALFVDQDGAGSAYSLQQVATISGVTGLTDEAALYSAGTIIA